MLNWGARRSRLREGRDRCKKGASSQRSKEHFLPLNLVASHHRIEVLEKALLKDYPSGAIEWGDGQWQIHVPQGGFGTFNLVLADRKAAKSNFRFYAPRIFVGIDAYNGGASEATVTIRCPEFREVTFTLKPGELRRLRTGWQDPSSRIFFEFKNAEGLQFDNLVYCL